MTEEQKKENRMVLKLQAALAAAEDRLSELLENPDDDATVLLARAAILDAENFFPPCSYSGRTFEEKEKAAMQAAPSTSKHPASSLLPVADLQELLQPAAAGHQPAA